MWVCPSISKPRKEAVFMEVDPCSSLLEPSRKQKVPKQATPRLYVTCKVMWSAWGPELPQTPSLGTAILHCSKLSQISVIAKTDFADTQHGTLYRVIRVGQTAQILSVWVQPCDSPSNCWTQGNRMHFHHVTSCHRPLSIDIIRSRHILIPKYHGKEDAKHHGSVRVARLTLVINSSCSSARLAIFPACFVIMALVLITTCISPTRWLFVFSDSLQKGKHNADGVIQNRPFNETPLSANSEYLADSNQQLQRWWNKPLEGLLQPSFLWTVPLRRATFHLPHSHLDYQTPCYVCTPAYVEELLLFNQVGSLLVKLQLFPPTTKKMRETKST